MKTGIYALYWEDQDLIYVGLSTKIEDRYRAHLYLLKGGLHDNFKVQNAYDKYGEPSLLILEECPIDSLNEREIYWISEFNSINEGLNIIEGGGHSYGVNHTTSKYSKRQILKVFSLLYRTNNSYEYIASKTGVKKTTIASIVSKKTHTWLSIYGDKYILATRNRDELTSKSRSINRAGKGSSKYTYDFISPEGVIHRYDCITSFLNAIGIFKNIKAAKSGFSRVINKHTNSYFDWKVIRNELY